MSMGDQRTDAARPRVGQWLYATCSAADYGQVMAVYQDANGQEVIDIRVLDVQDLLQCPDNAGWDSHHRDARELDFELPWLVELLVPPGEVLLKAVPWKPGPRRAEDGRWTIECATPGNGCFWCHKLFWLEDEPSGGEDRVR